jgi:hypothetical protein
MFENYMRLSTIFVCFLLLMSISNAYSISPPPNPPTFPFTGSNFDLSVTGSIPDSDNGDSVPDRDFDDTVVINRDNNAIDEFRDLDSIINRDLLALDAATENQEQREINEQLTDDAQRRALAKSNLATEVLDQQLAQRDEATATARVLNDLSPPTAACDKTKYDLAVHEIDGKANLRDVLKNLNGHTEKDVIFQMIVDNNPIETSLPLLDTVAMALKGKIIVPADDSDPKEIDYDIERVYTNCIANTLIDETQKLKSHINNPLIITDLGTTLLAGDTTAGARSAITGQTVASGAGQIFQECLTSDFAKYSIVADGKNLDTSGNAKSGDVHLKIKIVVDLDRSPITAKNAATVIDDNRIIALTLIADEGRSNEEIFEFIPESINTDCKTVSFLEEPVNIADKHAFSNPLYGFRES